MIFFTLPRFPHTNIFVATATPDHALLAPIVHKAEEKGLADISVQVKGLSSRAAAGNLTVYEWQSGNINQHGIDTRQPCILTVGELRVGTEKVMCVKLVYNHRVGEDTVGPAWLNAFKAYMEQVSYALD